jgi:polar amino acid transport system substrate-binding protein
MTRRARNASKLLIAAAATALIPTLLAACSPANASSSPSPAAAAVPLPPGVSYPSPSPAAAGAGSTTAACNPYASSLRPVGVMPAPGHMPAGSTMAGIQHKGQLVVGVDQNTYKFGYRDPSTGQIVGFDIDMARAVANAIFGNRPDNIQFVAITAAQRIPYLQQHKVDLVADTMTVNCDRLKQVAFSTVYYNAGQSVLVRKDSDATGIASLGGKKVCAAAGSTSITNIAAEPSKPIPVAVLDWTDCLVMLQQGQVDAISTDDTILRGLAAQDPGTKLVGRNFTQEPYGLAMNLDAHDFVAFVNGVLQQMRGDGGWAAIYAKWLGTPVPAPPPAEYAN